MVSLLSSSTPNLQHLNPRESSFKKGNNRKSLQEGLRTPWRRHIGSFWELHFMTDSKVLGAMIAMLDFQTSESEGSEKV
jgi:hypothetical protein